MIASQPPVARPRLLVVAPSAYPFGGVADWLDGFVAGLRARGWPLEVALLAGDHHDVDQYLERHPVGPVTRVENPSGSPEGRQRALAYAIERSGATLVLGVHAGDIEAAVGRVRCAVPRSPRLIVTLHALQRDFYDHLRIRRAAVDGVVVTNRLGVELARDHAGFEPERIAYAPYGVDVAAPALPRSSGERPLRIVWSGRLEQAQKRVDDLGSICAHLDATGVDYRLDVAGSGPEEERLARALAPQVVAGRARLLGAVERARLRADVYEAADVLLVTSTWETGPIVAWEALIAGLAVVASRYVGSGREAALRDGETAVLFPVGDAAAAAAALARVRDVALRRRLVAAGQSEVVARYSHAASLDAWETELLRLRNLPPRELRAENEAPPPAGRLDRWFGAERAESLRSLLGIRHRQDSAGAEWPHALAARGDEEEFLRFATALDWPDATSEGRA